MPGPARAGAMLYASNIELIASFYQRLLPMKRLSVSEERVVLDSDDFQLVVHAIPPHIPAPPAEARDSAVRLFFTVPNLSVTRAVAARLGGEVQDEFWHGPGFMVCNAADPEGNTFQVRELTA